MTHHAVISTFPSNAKANSAVFMLQKAGFDIQKLSLAKAVLPPNRDTGLSDRAPSTAVGLSLVGAVEAGVLVNPGIGPVMIAGPLASQLVSWAEAAMVDSAVAAHPVRSGLAAGLTEGLGIPKHKALQYETEIRASKFVLLVSGSHEEINQARQILQDAGYSIVKPIQDPGIEGSDNHPPHLVAVHPPHSPGMHPPHPPGVHPPQVEIKI